MTPQDLSIRLACAIVCFFYIVALITVGQASSSFFKEQKNISQPLTQPNFFMSSPHFFRVSNWPMFAKKKYWLQVVVWSCPWKKLAWYHSLTFCKKYLCIEKHNLRIIISNLFSGRIRPPLFLYFWKKIQQRNQVIS